MYDGVGAGVGVAGGGVVMIERWIGRGAPGFETEGAESDEGGGNLYSVSPVVGVVLLLRDTEDEGGTTGVNSS